MDCRAPLSVEFPRLGILEWVAISYSRGSSQPRDWTLISCTDRQDLYHWTTTEAQMSEEPLVNKLECLVSNSITYLTSKLKKNKWHLWATQATHRTLQGRFYYLYSVYIQNIWVIGSRFQCLAAEMRHESIFFHNYCTHVQGVIYNGISQA